MQKFLKEKYNTDKISYIYEKGKDTEKFIVEYEQYLDDKKKAKQKAKEEDKDKPKEDSFKKFGDSLVEKPKEELRELRVDTGRFSGDTPNISIEPKSEVEQIEIVEDIIETVMPEDIVETSVENVTINEEIVLQPNELKIDESIVETKVDLSSVDSVPASAANHHEAFNILKTYELGDLPEEAYVLLKKSFYEKESQRLLAGKPSEEDTGIELILVVHNPIDDAKKNMMGYIIDSCHGNGKVKFISQHKEELHEGWFDMDVVKSAVMSKIFNL